ncbi:MAG: GNAT family N-acetyltransferase [Promethearchaeota archaeon]|jgi:diamine N-acetyltransferase
MNKDDRGENPSYKVTLKKISIKNLHSIFNLKVKPNQENLVAPNAYSIAEAHFTRGSWYRAIYLGDLPIGFVMLIDGTLKFKKITQKSPLMYLWRFMIDGKYQGKGYGKEALQLVIDYVKSRPNVKEIILHHQNAKGDAGEFYKKVGFKHTGKSQLGELEMKLKLD